MDNVKFIEIENTLTGETDIHAIVTLSADSYESMPKAEYDRRLAAQVEHLTEIPTK
jgi:PHD/YefM family antitoxin component YafN of YafNO toxin-antitoxin module